MQNKDKNKWQELKKLVLKYEKNKNTYFKLEDFFAIIDYYASDEKFLKALEVVSVAELFYPASVEIKTMKTNLLIETNDIENARKTLGEFEFSDETTLDVSMIKGKIAIKQHNVRTAKKMFDTAIEISGFDKRYVIEEICFFLIANQDEQLLIKYLEILRNCGFYDKYLMEHLAGYCFFNKQENKAVEILNELTEIYPFEKRIWDKLGNIYLSLCDFENAERAFDFSLSIKYETNAQISLATTKYNLGKIDEALNLFSEIYEADKKNMDALLGIAKCNESKALYQISEQQYLEIIKQNPDFALAFFGLATVNFELGNYGSAEIYVRRAIEIDEYDYFFKIYLYRILVFQKKYSDADKIVKPLLKNKELDDSIEFWLVYANTLAVFDIKKAINILEKKIETVFYNSPKIYYNIASFYFRIGNMEKCLEKVEHALLMNEKMMRYFFEICPEASGNQQIIEAQLLFKTRKK